MRDPNRRLALTVREKTVLQLGSEGRTDRAIAEELGISKSTVGGHWSRIRLKLGAASRTEAVALSLMSEKAVVEAHEHLLMAELAERETQEDVVRKVRAVLEQVVKQRTAELTLANEKLRAEIAVREKAERASRESEARFRSIVENTAAGYFFVDPDGRYRAVNAAWLRLHKYDSPEEALGQHFSVTQAEEDVRRADEVVKQVLSGRPIHQGEFTRRCKDGSIGWHSFTATSVREGGEVVGLEGFLIDVTERKLAEAALFESERRCIDMLRSVELIAVTLDRDARVTFCNNHLLRLTDRTRDEVLGSNWFELFVPPENDERKNVFAALLGGLPTLQRRESEIVTSSGARRLIRWTNTLLHSASGAVIGTASIGEDVTDRLGS